MNIIKMRNLVVTSTVKKGNFKFTGKITPVTGKSNPHLNNLPHKKLNSKFL